MEALRTNSMGCSFPFAHHLAFPFSSTTRAATLTLNDLGRHKFLLDLDVLRMVYSETPAETSKLYVGRGN